VIYLLDTNVLSEPCRAEPDAAVMVCLERHRAALATASVVIHELHYGIARLRHGARRERLASYLRQLLASGLPVLPYHREAALWHAEERARLDAAGTPAPWVDGQIAAIAASHGLILVTSNIANFRAFSGLQLANWWE
jgi:tRNA(fMet)-specific endonuclease VapC